MNQGGIIRAAKANRFTCIPNAILRSKDLSIEQKGLLCYLLSLPDNWKIYQTSLAEHLGEKPATISRVFKSLQKAGYIESRRLREGQHFTGWEHIVHESPFVQPSRQGILNVEESSNDINTVQSTNTNSIPEEKEKEKEPEQPKSRGAKLSEQRDELTNQMIPFKTVYHSWMLNEFWDYWTEPNKSRKNPRVRYKLENTWDVKRRLKTWAKNCEHRNTNPYITLE